MSGHRGGFFGGWFFHFTELLLQLRIGRSFDEGDGGRSAVHDAALMRPALIVADEIIVKNDLHLLDGLEPSSAAFDMEVFLNAVRPLDDAADTCRNDTLTQIVGKRSGSDAGRQPTQHLESQSRTNGIPDDSIKP